MHPVELLLAHDWDIVLQLIRSTNHYKPVQFKPVRFIEDCYSLNMEVIIGTWNTLNINFLILSQWSVLIVLGVCILFY